MTPERILSFRGHGMLWTDMFLFYYLHQLPVQLCRPAAGVFYAAHASFGGAICARCRWAMKKPAALAANTT